MRAGALEESAPSAHGLEVESDGDSEFFFVVFEVGVGVEEEFCSFIFSLFRLLSSPLPCSSSDSPSFRLRPPIPSNSSMDDATAQAWRARVEELELRRNE